MAKDPKQILQTIQKYGGNLGNCLYTPERRGCDPNYNQRKKEGGSLYLNYPIPVYYIATVIIVGTRIVINDSNGDSYVEIEDHNGKKNLRLPIMNLKDNGSPFGPVNSETVKKAIDAFEHNKQDRVLFTDYDALYREVTALNNANATKVNKFIEYLGKYYVGTLNKANEIEAAAFESAKKGNTGIIPRIMGNNVQPTSVSLFGHTTVEITEKDDD
jgi:hypothetical protein